MAIVDRLTPFLRVYRSHHDNKIGARGLWGGGGVGSPHGLPRAYVRVCACVLCCCTPIRIPLSSILTPTPTELCGFILTTQHYVFHAAEETIRNGPYVLAIRVIAPW